MKRTEPSPLELWAGPECTINRTNDGYTDQFALSGHDGRVADLDVFATLGITAIRYPVLWERMMPEPGQTIDWTWPDARLNRLRDLGIRPIVGLVHHGSGPRHTSLLADNFAAGLASFAERVAERYPWVRDWTPVNEPVTTARFSALYGQWYPHARDERSFWRALLNQIEGVAGAMRGIRRVNPQARLIQVDDLGRTFATTPLQDQAGFDNQRRWAGWDLLFGRATRDHPLWDRIAGLGLQAALERMLAQPCPPDVIGVNHYLTSDRFLDHRLERYPLSTHGGNGRARYADVEAVRVLDPPPAGLATALREAWQRYQTPLAVTEVHNGCTREEQLRWAANAWDDAVALRQEGACIEAVTAWSLLGSHGWDTLLTRPGKYESGVFDLVGGHPRPTALATLWKGLPQQAVRHPVARQPGWWAPPDRLAHPPRSRPASLRLGPERPPPPLLICGATGTLGQAFARACQQRGIAYRLIGRDIADLERRDAIIAALHRLRPWGVVNATGWVRVDDAEDHADACHRINAEGAIALAEEASSRGIAYLGFSSDLVFDGLAAQPYLESDLPSPINVYGHSKLAMERGCVDLPGALIVRTAAFFSAQDDQNFAVAVATALAANRHFRAASDQVVSPTFVPALVDRALDLLIDGEAGIWHLAGTAPLSWAAFARRIARALDLDAELIEPTPGQLLGQRASRPAYSALTSIRGGLSESLECWVERFAAEWRQRLGGDNRAKAGPACPTGRLLVGAD